MTDESDNLLHTLALEYHRLCDANAERFRQLGMGEPLMGYRFGEKFAQAVFKIMADRIDDPQKLRQAIDDNAPRRKAVQ